MAHDQHCHTGYTIEGFEMFDTFVDLELDITCTISAYTPASMYGGPDRVGWEAEGGEIEDLDITIKEAIDEDGLDLMEDNAAEVRKQWAEKEDEYMDKIEEHIRDVANGGDDDD